MFYEKHFLWFYKKNILFKFLKRQDVLISLLNKNIIFNFMKINNFSNKYKFSFYLFRVL